MIKLLIKIDNVLVDILANELLPDENRVLKLERRLEDSTEFTGITTIEHMRKFCFKYHIDERHLSPPVKIPEKPEIVGKVHIKNPDSNYSYCMRESKDSTVVPKWQLAQNHSLDSVCKACWNILHPKGRKADLGLLSDILPKAALRQYERRANGDERAEAEAAMRRKPEDKKPFQHKVHIQHPLSEDDDVKSFCQSDGDNSTITDIDHLRQYTDDQLCKNCRRRYWDYTHPNSRKGRGNKGRFPQKEK